jgi:uncharacterized protein with WD repeat
LITYSADGQLAAFYVGDQMTVYRTADGSVACRFQHAKIKMVSFSPKNTLLQTWQYHEKTQPDVVPPDTLILWNLETGERGQSWLRKSAGAW